MKFSLKTLLWGFLLLSLSLFGYFMMFPEPVTVETALVTEGPLRVTVQEDGKTRIREKYIVSAPVSGQLQRIKLKPGDRCEHGTLLAVILPRNPAILDARAQAEATARVQAAEAALQRAESSADQAEISHALARSKYDRAERLLPKRAISQDEYDIARNEQMVSAQAIKTAKFDVQIAAFEVELARAALKQFSNRNEESTSDANESESAGEEGVNEPFEIYAPTSGRVLRVMQESSAVVTVGTSLLELGEPQNLEVEIDVLSTDAVRIKLGAELTIEHWGGDSPLRGNVRVIEPGAFTKISSLGVEEQRVNIIADFDESPHRLKALGDAYRVEARITVDELDNALLIPNSALFRHQRQWHVMAVLQGKATLQRVEVGLQSESHSEVLSGLQQGDFVIVYPSDDLVPGTAVRTTSQGTQATSIDES